MKCPHCQKDIRTEGRPTMIFGEHGSMKGVDVRDGRLYFHGEGADMRNVWLLNWTSDADGSSE